MALSPDQMLEERYRVVRVIKSGGMGSVYEAVDTKLANSPCAIKEVLDSAQEGPHGDYIRGRFFEEMKALAALEHSHIPRIRDFLEKGDTVYIVMELVQGRSLEDEILERLNSGQNAPVEQIVSDTLLLLDTLDYLHNQEPPIVHRDIKPANILRDRRSGKIKLVDFGLARTVQSPKTQTVVGTMGYCSPEQLMGKAEIRSDLYSVGVTMAHLLTGIQPEMDLFEARRPDLPTALKGLVDIIARSTEPKPQDRFGSAREMAAALQAWQEGKAPPAAALTAQSSPNQGKILAGLGLGALLTMVLIKGVLAPPAATPVPSPSPRQPEAVAVTPAPAPALASPALPPAPPAQPEPPKQPAAAVAPPPVAPPTPKEPDPPQPVAASRPPSPPPAQPRLPENHVPSARPAIPPAPPTLPEGLEPPPLPTAPEGPGRILPRLGRLRQHRR